MAKCQIYCSGFGFVLNNKNKKCEGKKKSNKSCKSFLFCFFPFAWLDESVDHT